MSPLVIPEFLSCAKALGTYIYAVTNVANRIGTFDTDSMSEVTCTRIALV
jgi:hypothetical protein